MATAVAVEVQLSTPDCPVDDAYILQAANAALSEIGKADHDVCVRLVDCAESQTLNNTYRGLDKPTNVLSFPAEIEMPEVMVLGDIAICSPVVLREAADQNKAAEHHFAHMVVHGVLHLSGYDHENNEDARVMEAIEVKTLSALGIADPYQ